MANEKINFNELDESLSCAKIIGQSDCGLLISSAGARISTTEGTAFSVLKKSQESDEANVKLVGKVLNSGHKTVIEHHVFNLAFNNVSVIVEQFLIEFRLTSFTIKSRRYVDFTNAGYYMPAIENAEQREIFEKATNYLFKEYASLMEGGLIKEDARFLLPYNFKSNILCTVNARELLHIICTMIYGRGSVYKELVDLGTQLKEQLESIYPDLVEKEKSKYSKYAPKAIEISPKPVEFVESEVELISSTQNIDEVLKNALEVAGLEKFEVPTILTDGKYSRVLEQINFTFKIKNITLASLTHFTRHRMHSHIIPNLNTIINENKYKVAPTIKANPEFEKTYKSAIEKTATTIENLKELGAETLSYLYVSGRTIDVLTTMNARELLWFFKLRTCDRAQWEIREIAIKMLKMLKAKHGEIFNFFGPSCLVDGRCPEGRLTCGKMKTPKDFE